MFRPSFYYNTDLETHLNMNKKTILTLIALTALLTVEAQQHRTVQFFAHRGSRLEYDENTMPASAPHTTRASADTRPTYA